MYECPNCAANLKYNIEKQALWCEACDTVMSPYDVVKDRDAEEHDEYEVTVFICPQCGGEIVSEDNEAAAFCSFCGGSTILTSRISKSQRPAYIIPFTKTKQDCVASYRKMVKRSIFMPNELRDASVVEGFRGIYMPFWLYKTEQHKRVNIDVTENKTKREGDYVYRRHFSFNSEIDSDYSGVSFDASGAFSDKLSNAISPFDSTKMVDFTPSYLSGFYADSADVPSFIYEDNAIDCVAEDSAKKLMRAPELKGYTMNQEKAERALAPKVSDRTLVMFPVWFMSLRRKAEGEEDRVSYVAINGQTGEAAGDMPISLSKYISISVIIAALIFIALSTFVSLGRLSLVVITTILLITMEVTYRSQQKEIKAWEDGDNDEGLAAIQNQAGASVGSEQLDKILFLKSPSVPAVIVTIALWIINPLEDMWFYGSSVVMIVYCAALIIRLLKKYNLLASRRLPQFKRTGGDDSAKGINFEENIDSKDW